MSARLELEYDGAGFAGWARQPGRRTVQAEVERALHEFFGASTALTVAGRTDAGVHARGQVASHAGEHAPPGALNARLPADVRVLVSEPAEEGFDARYDARSRTYRYRVLTGGEASVFERDRALHFHRALDFGALEACAAALPGRHDFTAFTPSRGRHKHFEREILAAEWERESERVIAFEIEADTFLHNMVRILVGTMLTVAEGKMTVDRFTELLAGAPRSEAANTASPVGLYLEAVSYRDPLDPG